MALRGLAALAGLLVCGLFMLAAPAALGQAVLGPGRVPVQTLQVPAAARQPSARRGSKAAASAGPSAMAAPMAAAASSATAGVNLSFLGWNGATERPDGGFHEPPDSHCAVGSGAGSAGRLVVVTNNGLKLMGKDGSTIVGATRWDTASGFFGALVVDQTDPKAIFDRQSQRFFIILQDGNDGSNSNLYIAASRTATPNNLTTDWNKFRASAITTTFVINPALPASGGNVVTTSSSWADYPGFGSDATRIVGTWNMFDNALNWNGIKIRVWDKASLISTGAPAQVFNDINLTAGTTGVASGFSRFTLMPAGVQSSTGTTDNGRFYLWNIVDNTTNGYRVMQLQGAPPGTTVASEAVVGYDGGATHAAFLTTFAPQSGGSPTIDTLSNRTMAATYRNGIITACNCGQKDGDAPSEVFWVETNTNGGGSPTTRQFGTIEGQAPASDWVYMPAIQVNDRGQTCLCYCESSSSKFVEIRYRTRDFADTAGTMQASVLGQAGVAHYDDFGPGSPERWGDYAAVHVDPNDDSFWMAQEFARAVGAGGWGVQIIKTQAPTDAQLQAFTASSEEGGTALQWRTGFEAQNAGFNVWAEEGGLKRRLTPSLIAGSAFVTRGAALSAGQTYHWWEPGSPASSYWLEAVDLSGQSRWWGPIWPGQADTTARAALQGRARAAAASSKATAEEPRRSLSLARLAKETAERDGGRAARRASRGGRIEDPRMAELASRQAVKLTVREEGWYRVSQEELAQAGLPADADPRGFRLFAEGGQQAILVNSSQKDRFLPGDSLEFYGLGLETPVTDARVYWLVWGNGRGDRIDTPKERKAPLPTPSGFPYTLEHEERTIYASAIRNGEASNFFGRILWGDPSTVPLTVGHLDPSGPSAALLEVTVQGVTDQALSGPDHDVQVLFNGTVVGEVLFRGQEQGVLRVALPPGAVHEGENELVLQRGPSVPPAGLDISLLDTVRLTYQHAYTADGDSFRFTALGGSRSRIDGFSGGEVRVLDVTDDAAPLELATTPSAGGLGFSVPGSLGQPRLLLAFTDGAVREPAGIAANEPGRLRPEKLGQLVILTDRRFEEALEPLRARREQQGISASLVPVDDVYDEFNWGEKSPAAIRAFLARASRSGRDRTRYALLAGDASYDPRDYVGGAAFDLVPTKLLDTALMETASDDWLADFDGDALPDLAIGRLPFRSADQGAALVAKLLAYENTPPAPGGTALLVADENDGYRFDQASAAIGNLLPAGVTGLPVSSTRSNAVEAREAVLSGLASGQVLVNYCGHGSMETWARGVLTTADARSIPAGGRLSLVTLMTCLNGFFQDVGSECLAETLLENREAGAVAVWASSSLTEGDEQAVMAREFYRLLFQGGKGVTLGEAAARAKAATGDLDTRRSWIFFGDPSSRLRW